MKDSTGMKATDWNDEDSNTSANPQLSDLIQTRLNRRAVMQAAAGVMATSAAGVFGLSSSSALAAPDNSCGKTLLGFKAVGHSLADKVVVPEGYEAQIIYAFGDPLTAKTPAFKNDGTDEAWDERAGDHHDGMEWFGLDSAGKPSDSATARGLLAMNHEATTDEAATSFFIHADGGQSNLPRPAPEVDKEIDIHGMSVVEVQVKDGQWRYQQDSKFNRRITPMTPAMIQGPAKGSPWMVTKFSADGTRARGTINNCGTGKTPWGTIVSGEENWNNYFFRSKEDDDKLGKKSDAVTALNRYGKKAGAASRHGWESAGEADKYQRWNISAVAASAKEDYRNEMNTYGYIVEMDPYDGSQTLRKRTALGRFAHETASFANPVEGQPLVVYMGDDARGEYMYKFVSKAKWRKSDANPVNKLTTGDRYLDEGTLFVAKFHDDGTGEWIELSMNNPILAANPDFSFKTDADIAIFTRLAGDAVNATKMDRPEWGGVNPKTGEIYMTLTNNSQRTLESGEQSLNAANPRHYNDKKGEKENKGNVNGHIIRLAETQATDTAFKWDIYLFGAEHTAGAKVNLSKLTADNDFSAPDGLVFSPSTGICWIQTDDGAYTDVTNCMMLAAVPGKVGDGSVQELEYTRKDGSEVRLATPVGAAACDTTLKRFLVGPKGAEITGWCETPDGKAVFINIQHPGENTKMANVTKPDAYESQWPANAGYGAGKRPRSATIVITKKDGGVVGT